MYCLSLGGRFSIADLIDHLTNPGRGALNFFFDGCVPHGFPKVGSRERIFLENEGSRERKFAKFAP